MTTMTPAQADAVWDAIDGQRARTADLLEQLTAEQWDHPSLCQGWTRPARRRPPDPAAATRP